MKLPNIYRTAGSITGLPLNWQDEVSGVLPAAVTAYLNNRIDGTTIDEMQLELVRAFMQHYIEAPCWNHMRDGDESATLDSLRKDVLTIRTPEEMGQWIHRCLDIGIDPL